MPACGEPEDFENEAADGSEINPAWPPLPPGLKPPAATGYPPYGSTIWQEIDNSWRVMDGNGVLVVCDGNGMPVKTVAPMPTGGTLEVPVGGNGVTYYPPGGGDPVTLQPDPIPPSDPRVGQGDQVWRQAYNNARANCATPEEAQAAARQAVADAGLDNLTCAANTAAVVGLVVASLNNAAAAADACNTALGPLVSACAYAKETIQSALDALNYIAGVIQTGRDAYTHNGGATHDACYSPWTSLSSQLTPDLLAVQADLQTASDAWSYWQSFDCAWYHASAPADQGQSVRDTVNAAMSDALAKLGAWQDAIAAMRDDDCAFAGLDDLVASMPNGWTPPPKQHESGDPGGP